MATTTRENKERVQRFIREANDQNYDQVAELLTADYTRRDPDTPGGGRGPEPFVETLQQLHDAFPDSEGHIGEIIARTIGVTELPRGRVGCSTLHCHQETKW